MFVFHSTIKTTPLVPDLHLDVIEQRTIDFLLKERKKEILQDLKQGILAK